MENLGNAKQVYTIWLCLYLSSIMFNVNPLWEVDWVERLESEKWELNGKQRSTWSLMKGYFLWLFYYYLIDCVDQKNERK